MELHIVLGVSSMVYVAVPEHIIGEVRRLAVLVRSQTLSINATFESSFCGEVHIA